METKFTKGEWTFKETSSINNGIESIPQSYTVRSKDEDSFYGKSITHLRPICGDSLHDEYRYDNETTVANAKLIASAPELLKKLDESTKMIDSILFLLSEDMSTSTLFGLTAQIKENKELI